MPQAIVWLVIQIIVGIVSQVIGLPSLNGKYVVNGADDVGSFLLPVDGFVPCFIQNIAECFKEGMTGFVAVNGIIVQLIGGGLLRE